MKYKIVAFVDLLLGLLQTLVFVIFVAFVAPNLSEIYSELGTTSTPNLMEGYFIWLLVLLMGFINLFIGFKLVFGDEEVKKKFHSYGILSAIVTFVLVGILVAIASFLFVLPIYNLTSQF